MPREKVGKQPRGYWTVLRALKAREVQETDLTVRLGVAEHLEPLPADQVESARRAVEVIEREIPELSAGRVPPSEAILVAAEGLAFGTVPARTQVIAVLFLTRLASLLLLARALPESFRAVGVLPASPPPLRSVAEARAEGERRMDAYRAWIRRAWSGTDRGGPYERILSETFRLEPRVVLRSQIWKAGTLLGVGKRSAFEDWREVATTVVAMSPVTILKTGPRAGYFGLNEEAIRTALLPLQVRAPAHEELTEETKAASRTIDAASRAAAKEVWERLAAVLDPKDLFLARHAKWPNTKIAKALKLSEGAIRKRRTKLQERVRRLGFGPAK